MANTEISEKQDIKIKEPSLYNIILLNDNYTTMEFVTKVLQTIFHKNIEEANRIMLDVHNKGRGIVGKYTYDTAITKTQQVERVAKDNQFPLKTIVEEA